MTQAPLVPTFALLLAAVVALAADLPARAQSFTVDFARWSGPPLVKTKFGVYQTPLLALKTVDASLPLLREAGIQDFRYEMGWGKPDAQAYDQITGTAAEPRIDFAPIDGLVAGLKAAGVQPLFALTYDPLPLKTGDGWQRWKDVPSDLIAWRRITQAYAEHSHKALHLSGPAYEVWNEPDLPGDGGKVFFNGGPADYARLYAVTQAGVRVGDADALVGGPGLAYDTAYAAGALAHPMDFVSFHAYANAPDQIHAIRPLVVSSPGVSLFLTEYASYKDFGPRSPNSRAEGAARFFADAATLLSFPDVTRVYWAQWADESLGMLTRDLHRKALFNALKIYQTLLPVDRSPVVPDAASGVHAMAASGGRTGCVVLWSDSDAPRSVTVSLTHLPSQEGNLAVIRIDTGHASFVDDPASEALTVQEKMAFHGGVTAWVGQVPPHGVVLLRATGGDGTSLLEPASVGTYVRTYDWFSDREGGCYADYDSRACIARLGMGGKDSAVAQIGIVLDRPAAHLRVQVARWGAFARRDGNTLFGIRVDYRAAQGWARSVLWHDGSYDARHTSPLPWGKGGAEVDQAVTVPALAHDGGAFVLDLARRAPPGWTGRVLLTPILQNEGSGAQVRLIFRAALVGPTARRSAHPASGTSALQWQG